MWAPQKANPCVWGDRCALADGVRGCLFRQHPQARLEKQLIYSLFGKQHNRIQIKRKDCHDVATPCSEYRYRTDVSPPGPLGWHSGWETAKGLRGQNSSWGLVTVPRAGYKGRDNHYCNEFAIWSDNTKTGPEGKQEGTELKACTRREKKLI